MSSWVPSAKIRESIGFTKPVPGQLFKKNHKWIRKAKSGRGYEFDVQADGYIFWSKEYIAKNQKKTGSTEPIKKTVEVPQERIQEVDYVEEGFLSPEQLSRREYMEKLRRDADEANLLIPVKDLEKKEIEVEQKRVEYLKRTGKLLDANDVEYSYFSYLEKFNVDVINSPKKLKNEIESLFKKNIVRNLSVQQIEDDSVRDVLTGILNDIDINKMSTEFINSLMSILESIIITIKKSQAAEAQKLKDEYLAA